MRNLVSRPASRLGVTFAVASVCVALLSSAAGAVDDNTPPTVVVSDQGASSTAPFTVDFSEPVSIPNLDAVSFVESEDATNLPGALDCASGFVAGTFCQTWSFTPSEQTVLNDVYDVYFQAAPGYFADQAGNEMPQTFLSVRGASELDASDPAIRYRWSSRNDSEAIDGSISREREQGATFSYTFKGRSVVWYTMLGPDQGTADVAITRPGRPRLVRSVNNRSATVAKQWPVAFHKLGAGFHTITVSVAGDPRNHEANNQFVTVDALKVRKTMVDDANLQYTWHLFDTERWTYQPNARVAFQFRGSSIFLGLAYSPDAGKLRVLVDGKAWGIVDLYADSGFYSTAWIDGLSDTKHTVTVVTLGAKNLDSTGHVVGFRYASYGTCEVC
jgi:hypothetical protein